MTTKDINQIDTAIRTAYATFVKNIDDFNEAKFKVTTEEIEVIKDGYLCNIWLETITPSKFNSNIGPTQTVDLFALHLMLKITLLNDVLKFSIVGYFNPILFKGKVANYNKIGSIVKSGTNNIFSKELSLDVINSPSIIYDSFVNCIKVAVNFYIK